MWAGKRSGEEMGWDWLRWHTWEAAARRTTAPLFKYHTQVSPTRPQHHPSLSTDLTLIPSDPSPLGPSPPSAAPPAHHRKSKKEYLT